MGTGKILVFNPTGTKSGKEKVGAPRLSGIDGKRIGVIWNGKLGGDVFLSRVSEILAERFGVTVVERVDDRGDTNRVIDQAVVNRLVATCDAAVIGTGDWGGCSLWCIQSAIELEKRGLPTTTICTTNFSALLKTTAKAKGLVDMPLVIVTHPIALNDNAAIRKKADGAIEDVVRTLVTADARTAAKGGR